VTVLAPFADDPELAPLLEAARNAALPSGERARIERRLAELLDLVKADDDARQEYLTLLDELAAGDPAETAAWRRKLSSRLF
jgi:thioredoxin-like negative regulator of GroEL